MVEKKDIELKLIELKNKIDEASYFYYVENRSFISDEEYDSLMQGYQSCLENYKKNFSSENHDFFRFELENYGGAKPSNKFKKIAHRVPMLSLDNIFDFEGLKNFISRIDNFLNFEDIKNIEFSLEPKIDGISFSAVYENGELKYALTRGDGKFGEDITDNILNIKDFPQYIKIKNLIEIRGEIFISKENFNKLNESQLEKKLDPFANPRNAASGSLRQLELEVIKQRPLEYIAYNFIMLDGDSIDDFTPSTQEENLIFLKMLNFNTFLTQKALNFKETGFSVAYILNEVESIQKIYEYFSSSRDKIPYEIDGLVIKINSLHFQNRLGATQKSPRHSIAYKFSSQKVLTRIIKVEYQVGRTGAITPIAIVDPVYLSGASISKATLHNFNDIKKKDIRLKDYVVITRSGDVIPKIIEVDFEKRIESEVKKILPPSLCPSCKSEVVKDDSIIKCINFNCQSVAIARIHHFVSSLEMQGIGFQGIQNLYMSGLVKNSSDIFDLHKREEDFLKLERTGKKMFKNMIRSIDLGRSCSLSRFIYSLGISNIGRNVAILIAKKFISLDSFLASREDFSELINIDGIGPNIVKDLNDFFKINLTEVLELTKNMNIEDEIKQGKLLGLSFVFTGTMNISRNEAKDIVQKNGGEVKTNISKGSILVYGDKPGEKFSRASKEKIKILSEQEFMDLIS